jgi:hypothetical protein
MGATASRSESHLNIVIPSGVERCFWRSTTHPDEESRNPNKIKYK